MPTRISTTTALRFHPDRDRPVDASEDRARLLIGPSVAAVVVFEVVLNGMAMFNHANFHLPAGLDRLLRRVVVTPDMHRVHHSTIQTETDSNYGFNLSVWDRLFGSYVDQPTGGHAGMAIGLDDFPGDQPTRLGWAIAAPFRAPRTGTAQ
ncbi:MAG: sterol desaturase family protein [Hyphomicrobiales bacterium]